MRILLEPSVVVFPALLALLLSVGVWADNYFVSGSCLEHSIILSSSMLQHAFIVLCYA